MQCSITACKCVDKKTIQLRRVRGFLDRKDNIRGDDTFLSFHAKHSQNFHLLSKSHYAACLVLAWFVFYDCLVLVNSSCLSVELILSQMILVVRPLFSRLASGQVCALSLFAMLEILG